MNDSILWLGVAIGVASFYGAAYLLALWHEDAAELRKTQRVTWRTWTLSRVLAYLAIVGTLGSNVLGFLTLIRLANVPAFREIQIALTPLSLLAILTLDALFTILALYLRLIRKPRP